MQKRLPGRMLWTADSTAEVEQIASKIADERVCIPRACCRDAVLASAESINVPGPE